MTKLDLHKIREFGNIELLARQMVEGFITGLHRSPFHGFSVEFAEHRLYNTGESTKHIDWKVYAKTDKIFVKRYEEETNLRCQILIDISSSMYYPKQTKGKLSFSVMAAAAIAYMAQRQRDAISIATFDEKIIEHSPIKSTSIHLHQLFMLLQKLLDSESSMKTTSAAKVLHEIAEKIHRRSLVVIFSDMFEQVENPQELFGALQHLKHQQHEVLLFHVMDKKTEKDFIFENRPYEFIDLETGEKVRLQPNQVQETYQTYVENFSKELKIKCGQYKIDFIEVDIAENFEDVLYRYMVKRAKMR
ncbi:MAG: DUF58 domain-containing protein [Thermonemataceae bacterium]|nr:DUF58 domain-containing protein [Thermonemataceae bacterium]